MYLFSVVPIVFLTPLSDVTLHDVGGKATFECDVSKPGLKAEWYKNDKLIKRASDKYDVQVVSGNHKLLISDSQIDDVATYRIQFQGAQSSANLKINGT